MLSGMNRTFRRLLLTASRLRLRREAERLHARMRLLEQDLDAMTAERDKLKLEVEVSKHHIALLAEVHAEDRARIAADMAVLARRQAGNEKPG